MSLVVANYTRAKFAELLRSESLRCVRVSVERRWLSAVPESIAYYFPTIDSRRVFSENCTQVVVPPAAMVTDAELLAHLFRDADGHFRSEIGLSPFAVTEREIVIEVSLRNSSWTNSIMTGKHAFPNEPFVLSGPALPGSLRQGEPTPMVSLPRLQTGVVPGED